MLLFVCIVFWIIFSTGAGILARTLALKWAESRGWSALTMPMKYHAWFIGIYLVVVQLVWILLYAFVIHQ